MGVKSVQMKVIEAFLTLYEARSFSRASRTLFITQQGLSRQIRALETEVGQTLIDRSRMGAQPTEAAHRLYPYYRKIFDTYRESQLALSAGGGGRQQLRIGFAYGISSGGGADYLLEYQRRHPEVQVEIQEWSKEQCIQKLLHNRLDVAFLINPFPENLFRTSRITTDHMYAAMHKSHPLAAEDGPLEFRALAGEALITGSPENAMRQFFDYCCVLTQIHPRISLASGHNLDIINTMTENIGVATLNSGMALRVTNPDVRIRRLILPCEGYLYGCVPLYCGEDDLPARLLRYAQGYYARNPIPIYPAPQP